MKIFNTSTRQTFQHDYRDPMTGVVASYTSRPNRSINVPDEVAQFWLKGWPKHFSADEEAQANRVQQKQQLEERDQTIADLTARALKAELALEALATQSESEAIKAVEEPVAPKAPKVTQPKSKA